MDLREQIRFTLIAAVFGGLLAYLLETADRIVTLWPSFNAFYEIPLFALYLAPTVLLGALAGLFVGALFVAVELLRSTLARPFTQLSPGRSQALGSILAAVVIGAALRLAVGLSYAVVGAPLFRLAEKVHARIHEIPWVINHFGLVLTLVCLISGAKVVVLAWAMLNRSGRASAVVRVLAAIGSAAVTLSIYAVDSRLYFGRYESTMHVPAMIATLACVFMTAMACGYTVAKTKVATRIATITIVAAMLATGFAFLHTGSNKNVTALLWRRSIIARRAWQATVVLADRDRDGFASALGGADTDDANPAVNPLATEIPANGIDDNGIGGDYIASASEPLTTAQSPLGVARNFILVSIDTLRADRMSCYGYGRPTATQLDRVGAKGLVFNRAYSQGSNTGQSFASMQKSATRGAVFDDSRPTMFRRFQDAGYATTIINARRDDAWLETRRWVRYRKIILDGVSTYDHVDGESLWDGDAVTDRAIEYLSSLDPSKPHATWVHYLDPHEPRKKMAPFDFGDSASDMYDSEVAFADREVARLIDWLESTGRLRDTVVVLVADHGESFLDHGMDLHGNRPYDEQIHVPLMMWAPEVTPHRIDEAVGVVDIAPSVLAYFGLPAIPGQEGRDILRSEPTARPMFAETPLNLNDVSFFAYAVTDGGWRYIYDVRGNTEELYDLESDPSELHNLADVQPDRVAGLRSVMARWLDSTVSVRSLRDVSRGRSAP